MNTRGSSASARACASRMASKYVMLTSGNFEVRFHEVLRSQRTPILFVGIGRRLALHGRNCFFDLVRDLAAPRLNGNFVRPTVSHQLLLGDLQAITSDGRRLEFCVDIAGIIMFTVSTKPKQTRNDH